MKDPIAFVTKVSNQVNATNDPLIIPFEALFLRPPFIFPSKSKQKSPSHVASKFAHLNTIRGLIPMTYQTRQTGWGPEDPYGYHARWPVEGLEVAISRTRARVQLDVYLWLDPGSSNTNIAIAVKANRTRSTITFGSHSPVFINSIVNEWKPNFDHGPCGNRSMPFGGSESTSTEPACFRV